MTNTKPLNAMATGRADCDTAVSEGADPADLARTDQLGADEALINAMGREWVIAAAGGANDTDEAWARIGVPWCAAYSAAYRARALELAAEAVRS